MVGPRVVGSRPIVVASQIYVNWTFQSFSVFLPFRMEVAVALWRCTTHVIRIAAIGLACVRLSTIPFEMENPLPASGLQIAFCRNFSKLLSVFCFPSLKNDARRSPMLTDQSVNQSLGWHSRCIASSAIHVESLWNHGNATVCMICCWRFSVYQNWPFGSQSPPSSVNAIQQRLIELAVTIGRLRWPSRLSLLHS